MTPQRKPLHYGEGAIEPMPHRFHGDPGHEWLEVTDAMLADVGLSYLDFSQCSYKDGHRMYLEGDCDAAKYLRSYEQKHGSQPAIQELHVDRDHWIRDLPRNRLGIRYGSS